jgi:hypothetical protein
MNRWHFFLDARDRTAAKRTAAKLFFASPVRNQLRHAMTNERGHNARDES